ncbi:MAG TPA: hypothetical protein VMZ71_02810, partial [Gemmataceae bacterium]|nr:hypothetical protein [Gemmataceae bacterium]
LFGKLPASTLERVSEGQMATLFGDRLTRGSEIAWDFLRLPHCHIATLWKWQPDKSRPIRLTSGHLW